MAGETSWLKRVWDGVAHGVTTAAAVVGLFAGSLWSGGGVQAHNLQTRMVFMFFDPATQACLDARIDHTTPPGGWTTDCPQGLSLLPGDPVLQVNDQIGVIIKVVPQDGTTTGVGGHIDFYVPNGMQVTDVGYLVPDGKGGYEKVAMKGQSPIAIGAGPVGAKATSQLIGLSDTYSSSASGLSSQAVNPTTGLHRGTIAGVYGDTGIFFSTDPDTAYGSWQRYTEANGGSPTDWNETNLHANHCGSLAIAADQGITTNGKTITNNSGDTVVPCNKWDAGQLYAWGVSGTNFTGSGASSSPIVDYGDGRGNAPWGFASGVAGPQSGYAWNFDWDEWRVSGKTAADMRLAMDPVGSIGPWERIRYDGDRVSFDQPGLASTVLGYASKDAGNLGATMPLAATTSQTDTTSPKAIRWAIGQLTAYRPEYVWVKLKVLSQNVGIQPGNESSCPDLRGDTFGGDAGGTDNGKDHLWRYYEPTEIRINLCVLPGKPATDQFVKPGDLVTYPVKVYNLQDITLTNVVVKDTLGSGLTFVSAFPAQTTGPNPLIWNVGTLQPGQRFQSTLTAKVSGSGYVTNCVEVTSDQFPTPEKACDQLPSGLYPYLVPTKSARSTGIAPGGTVIYDVLVRNIGEGPTASPVTITEYLPAGFVYDPTYTPTAKVNGATVTPTVNAANPSQPVFTVASPINGNNQLTISFRAKSLPTVQPGSYCNSYSLTQGGVPITTGSAACVTVAGGQMGDTLFRDWDGDGTQDTGEEGLAGVTVTLTGAAGASCNPTPCTAVTDASGKYLFTGLLPGSYTVSVPSAGSGGVPSGYVLTADPDGGTISNTYTHVLAQDVAYLGADFGYQPTGSGTIGDRVYEDLGKDGLFNGSDVGIPNVTVWLYEDSNGNGVIDPATDALVATAQTNSSGIYSFNNLATSINYLVKVDKTDPDIQTYFNTKYDPDPVPYQLTTAEVIASPNLTGSDLDNDFGFWRVVPLTIGDQVYIESNNSAGYQPGADAPLANVTVTLYRDSNGDGIADGPAIATTTTDTLGQYSFTNLGPDSYLVVVDTNDPDVPDSLFPMDLTQRKVTLTTADDLTADFPFISALDKTVDKGYANPAGTVADRTLTYTIVPRYPSNELSSFSVSDAIPAGSTYVAASVAPVPPGEAVDETDPPDGVIESVVWDLGSNAVGAGGYIGGTPPPGCQTTMTLDATADTWIDEKSTERGKNYGADTELDTSSANNQRRAALLRWTLGATTLPAGATYQSATLRLTVAGGNNASRQVTIHELLTDWIEGTSNNGAVCGSAGNGATWDDPNCTNTGDWATSGLFGASDFNATSLGTVTPNGNNTTVTLTSAGLNTLVGSWLTGGTNRGLVMNPAGTDTGTVNWYSRETTTPANRPQIVITYTPNGCSGISVIRDAGDNKVPDTWIDQGSPTNNYGTNNRLKTRQQSGDNEHALVKFDLTGSVPTGATVSNAVMQVTVASAKELHSGEVHKMTTAWTEGTNAATGATWNDPNGTDTAGTWVGGAFGASDYDATILGTFNAASTGAKTLNITSTVAGWVTTPTTNNGVVILGKDGNDTDEAQYYSSEEGTASRRPTLTVNWSIAPSNPTGSNSLSAGPTLAQDGDKVTVTMTLTDTSGTARTGMAPSALTVTGTNGATCTSLSGPSPASATVPANGSVKFTWTCTADVPANTIGELTFSASATNGTGSAGTYSVAQSNSVIVAVPLSFQVTVNTTDAPPVIDNQAVFTAGSAEVTDNAQTATTATIGDLVWADLDGDGVKDTNEAGIAGVTVRLYNDPNNNGVIDPGETQVGSLVTDANGNYRFYNIAAGANYTVTYDFTGPLLGYLPTTDSDADAGKTVHDVGTITAGLQYNSADFGLKPPAATTGSIGDTVWLDKNSDGTQDLDGPDDMLGTADDETGLPAITVKLYQDLDGNGVIDANDPLIGTQVTDANGNYSFTNLAIGADATSAVKYLVAVDEANSTVTSPYGGSYNLATALDPTTGTTNPRPVSLYTGNANVTTADFGYNWVGVIGDYVWMDNNANGLQDESPATPIANAAVLLYVDANGNGILDPALGDYQIGFKMTNASGIYSFTNLPPGPYLVDVYEDSMTLDGERDLVPSTQDVRYVSLGAGQTVLTADFGYYQGAKVEGNVFHDNNRNGLLDGGEVKLANITVTLTGTDMFGNPITKTTTTDANGHFSFLVPEGNYSLSYNTGQTNAAGYPDPTTVTSFAFHAEPGEDWHPVFDFGVDYTGKVGDLVWNDANANDTQDPGEPGIAGVTVNLYASDGTTLLATTVTDSTGKYLFEGVNNGNYVVKVDPSTLPVGATQTYDNSGAQNDHTGTATVSGGGSYLLADFGYQPPGYNVSGRVWNDNGAGGGTMADGIQNGTEPGISGVTVSLVSVGIIDGRVDVNGDGAITTADDGSYGGYSVTDGVISAANGTPIYGMTVYGGLLDVNGSGGVNDSDDKPASLYASTTTNASGDYSFPGVPNGDYLIQVNDTTLPSTSYVQTGDPDPLKDDQTAIRVNNANVTNQNFGYNQNYGSISGSVVGTAAQPADGDGKAEAGEGAQAGVSVLLTWAGTDGILGTADDVVATVLTDAAGAYSFSAGTISPANCQYSSGSYPSCPLDNGLPPGPYQITKINPEGYTSLADADGLNPNNISLSLTAGQIKAAQDFEVKPTAGSIGDSVWLDVDRDGVQDIGEPGLANVSVALWSPGADGLIGGSDDRLIGVATTDLNGNYLFTDVPAGNYYVKVDEATLPNAGLTETAGNDDSNSGLFLLEGGKSYLEADFGYVGAANKAVIGDFLWSDANNNGLQDPGEPGIGGVTLTLIGAGPDGLFGTADDTSATTTTDKDGSYYFTNLNPGRYKVDVATPPAAYSLTVGPESSTDPTAVITVGAGQTYDQADFGYYNPALYDIADRVWFDADRDGTQDAGEAGIAGVTVNLYADLDGDGSYTEPVLSGQVDLNGDGSITAADSCSGCFLGYDLVNGVIYKSGSPVTGITLSGVPLINGQLDMNGDGTISALDAGKVVDEPIIATALSDDLGDFAFTGLPNGAYLIEIADNSGQLSGYQGTTTPAQQYQLPVTLAGADLTGVHFGYASLGPIGDTVFSDANGNGVQDAGELGIGGVTLKLYNDSNGNNVFDPLTDSLVGVALTDADGKYAFDNLVPGTYFVSVADGQSALTGYTPTTTDQEAADQSGASGNTTEISATLTTTAVSRPIESGLLDLNGNGIVLGEGGYVAGSDTGYAQGVRVIDGRLDLNDDGTISALDAGWWNGIRVIGGLLDLNADGSINALDTGSAAVSQSVFLNADFGYRNNALADISGTIWNDPNRNAVIDPTESGRFAGVSVDLVNCGTGTCNDGDEVVVATTTTNPSGAYSFPDVPAGSYRVVVTDESAVLNGYSLTSGLDQIPVTVTGTTPVTNVNFGYARQSGTASIGDSVWLDANNDGVFQPNETGLPGVTLALYADRTGDGVPDTTVAVESNKLDLNGDGKVLGEVGYLAGSDDGVWNGYNLIDGLLDLNGDGAITGADTGSVTTATGVIYTVTSGAIQTANGTINGAYDKALTDADGRYLFDALPAGSYQVDVVSGVPANLAVRAPATDPTATIALSAGQAYLDADFPYRPATNYAVLGDTVWYDVNANGVQDPGEAGIAGVSVQVLNQATGLVVATVTTGPDGTWLATIPEDATPTNYVVFVDKATLPGGVIPTPTNLGGGDTYIASAKAGDVILSLDFGYAGGSPASIGDTVFLDANNNGTADPGEGLGGVTLVLYSVGIIDGKVDVNGDGIITIADDGTYGDYAVTDGVLAGMAVGQTLNGMKVLSNGSGGGLLDVNGDGTLTIADDKPAERLDSTLTDASGNYLFTGLLPGDYRVDVASGVPAGLTLTSGSDPTSPITLSAGEEHLSADFGYRPTTGTAAIGDRVWSDADNDGLQDPGEVGIGGATVYLCLQTAPTCNAASAIKTAVTDPDGSYLFTGVTATGTQDYKVTVVPPAGYTATPTNNGGSTTYSLTDLQSGQSSLTNDWGFRATNVGGTIGDRIWNDADRDGVQDAGETGITGVTLNLVAAGTDGLFGTLDDLILASTITGANGAYSFTGVPAGSYQVVVTDVGALLADLSLTGKPASPTATISCTPSCNTVDTQDFGYAPAPGSGKIGDLVWFDKDGDGVKDADEPGISGVTLNLLDGTGKVVATTTTDANGAYGFQGLSAGSYSVAATDTNQVLGGLTASFIPTQPVTISCSSPCTEITTVDFGYKPTVGGGVSTLGGTIWRDTTENGTLQAGEPGIQGITVELWLDDGDGVIEPGIDNLVRTTTTDPSGNYQFLGLPPGAYIVNVTDTNGVTSGLTSVLGPNPTADNNGHSDPFPVTLAANVTNTTVDFAYANPSTLSTIGNEVFLDANSNGLWDAGEGIGGVTLRLYSPGPDGVIGGGDDTLVIETTTDANGKYLFDNLVPGTYYVDLVTSTLPSGGAGLTLTAGSDPTAVINLAPSAAYLGADFGYRPAVGTGMIGDRVWSDADSDGVQDSGEAGIGGVTVQLCTSDACTTVVATTTTAPDGSYLFTNVAAGTYSVVIPAGNFGVGKPLNAATQTGDPDQVSPPACTTCDNTDSSVVVASGGAYVAADFGYNLPNDSSIGDTLYRDNDGDGTQDVGEPGIAGVTLSLLNANGEVVASTATDANGKYSFTGLPPGTYTVQVTDTGGNLMGLTPTETEGPVTLAANQSYQDADFGYKPGGSYTVSGTVFEDNGGAGTLGTFNGAATDPVAPNATVSLYRVVNGVEYLVGTTKSNASGYYELTDLPAGSYVVKVNTSGTIVAGMQQTTDPDFDPTRCTSCDSQYAFTLSANRTGVNFGYWNGGVITTPITLSYFKASAGARKGEVIFEWETATEVGHLGFQLYVEDKGGEWEPVSLGLIPGGEGDSNQIRQYRHEAVGVQGSRFMITDLDILGREIWHGPFGLGESYGVSNPPSDPVDWPAIQREEGAKQKLQEENKREKMKERLEKEKGKHKKEGNWGWLEGTGRALADRLVAGLAGLLMGSAQAATLPVTDPGLIWLKVSQGGLQRVTYEELKAAGLDLAGADPKLLKLTNRGVAVPITVERGPTIKTNRFGAGWYLEFLGQPLDTLYTKTNVYALALDAAGGARIKADATKPPRQGTSPAYYLETVRVENELLYSYSAPNGDPWYAADLLRTTTTAATTQSFPISIDNYAGALAPVTLTVGMWGGIDWPPQDKNADGQNDPDHHVLISLNATQVADERFDGITDRPLSVSVPAGLIKEGANTLTLSLPPDTGYLYDKVNLDQYALTYPRAFIARGGSRLTAKAKVGATASQYLQVSGLSSAEVQVYREVNGVLTRLSAVETLAQAGGSYAARIPATTTEATYHIATLAGLGKPQLSPAPAVADLSSGPANYLLIAHPSFIDANLQRLVTARQGEGYSVKVADLEAVYAQFGYGIRGAEAIGEYIRYAYDRLGTRWVLLVGGDVYDYHNYAGKGALSFLPSPYASTDPVVARFAPVDPLYADIDRDGVPDFGIGRFPVRTSAELATLIDKTLLYGGPKAYARKSVFAADVYDSAKTYDFKVDADNMIGALPENWKQAVTRTYVDQLGVAAAKTNLKAAINSGVDLAGFIGHSSQSQWSIARSGALFTAADAAALTNAGKPTLVTQWGCWNNWHVALDTNTLGHKFLVAGPQGAAATLGAATLTEAAHERGLGLKLYDWLAEPGITLGEAMTEAKKAHAAQSPGDADVLLGWTLLGDPALVLEP